MPNCLSPFSSASFSRTHHPFPNRPSSAKIQRLYSASLRKVPDERRPTDPTPQAPAPTTPPRTTKTHSPPSTLFPRRHIGPSDADIAAMLQTIGRRDSAGSSDRPNRSRPASASRPPSNCPFALYESEALARPRPSHSKTKSTNPSSAWAITTPSRPPSSSRNILENPRLVYAIHALSGRDRPGPARSPPEFSDDGQRPDRPSARQRLVAR